MADKAAEFKKLNAEQAIQERVVDGKKEYLDESTGEWVSKSELKKRNTAKKTLAKATEKAAAKKANPVLKKDKAKEEDEDMDPTKYTENRYKMLEQMRANGENPYPHKFNRDMTVQQFRERFEDKKID
jgi:lysyl-tRNA synthetase class 2